ncbi:hypothetical protein EV356DRAFT_515315 [Viridothelium virens]|uniref:Exoribonuclease phosphorolytic domain-containing protein n=1 Tax=Viridothelium virens TaxID=1048519 RepID=A0A6A6HLT2_VIRVR|nr:hypothetical protein EV356DRAFT_515315 [Viridothelium virens]
MTVKDASLSTLQRADGSAKCEHDGYCVIGAVNGPIEVMRRDELPEEAAIEINVRPAVGVGSPTERHLETLLQSTLRRIIRVETYPRTLIQITLQVLSVPDVKPTPVSFLAVLPALLQTSLLALLSASIPLTTTYTATACAATSSGDLISTMSLTSAATLASFHVFAFTAQGDLLLAESEGSFDIGIWNKVYLTAEEICRGKPTDAVEDIIMDQQGNSLQERLQAAVQSKVEADRRWKSS